ncbi:MAG: FtsX-like permease family protein [Deltaproteobacteria bacterium]|nr:FtsX-like permease family protein [Deltaproteobacteria bacterium]
MNKVAATGLLLRMSMRSLWSHKIKSLIVGFLMFFGTFLVVLGSAMLDSIEHSMERTVVSSLAGHLQAYDATARDDLALFGGSFMGSEDIGKIDDFAPVKQALLETEGVAAAVPMGLTSAMVVKAGELDKVLEKLRDAAEAEDAGAMAILGEQVRQIARDLIPDYERSRALAADQAKVDGQLAILEEMSSEPFWASLSEDPIPHIDRLDSELAPLAEEGKSLWLRILGTDLEVFAQNFDRLKVVEGELPPPGRRGILLSKRFYEKQAKHRIARALDRLHEGVTERGQTIADDPLLSDQAKRLPDQYQRILFELTPASGEALDAKLKERFPEVEGALKDRLRAFLTVDDSNIRERHAAFYEEIAPLIELYPVAIGEKLILRSFTKAGYQKATPVQVWGIFEFSGLESSDLAGAQNLMDLITFREVYGVMTPAKKAELAQIKEAAGLEDVGADDAEAALFGEDSALVEEASETGFDELAGVDLAEGAAASQLDDRTYTQAEIDSGLALSVAVIAADPEHVPELQARVEQQLAAAGLELKVVGWQKAAGMVGQFLWVNRAVLYLAIFFIFAVALFIINNSMVIATLERVPEIGTLRAIGAQRSFITSQVLTETIALGVLAGGLGAAFALFILQALGQAGIPAGGVDILVFLFSGPKLYPSVGLVHVLIGVATILVVSILSTVYPAWIATRVQPVVAMGAGE